jgi:hypothetical protein
MTQMTNSNKFHFSNIFRKLLLLIGGQQILIVILAMSAIIVNDKDGFVQYYAYAKSINPKSFMPVIVAALLQSIAAISLADIMLLTCVVCAVLSLYLCILIIKGNAVRNGGGERLQA